MRLLVVDDEQTLLHQLKAAFESERYLVETTLDGEEALDKLAANPVDLVILDIMLQTGWAERAAGNPQKQPGHTCAHAHRQGRHSG